MRRSVLLPALALLLSAMPAAAAVIGTTGATSQIAAPASTLQDTLQSNTSIFLFAERASVTLATALSVDVNAPGTYSNSNLPVAGGAQIAAGTLVDSYFVHYDRVSQNQPATGSVTFDTDILGVLLYTATLEAGSDASLGNPTTLYIPLASDPNRGVEFGGQDVVTLAANLRTLSFTLRENANRVDQLRIVVAAPGPLIPEPDTALLFGAGLLVLGAVRQSPRRLRS